jgi:hypothetical protein
MGDWSNTLGKASRIRIGNQLKSDFGRHAISKGNHLLKLPAGIDMNRLSGSDEGTEAEPIYRTATFSRRGAAPITSDVQ